MMLDDGEDEDDILIGCQFSFLWLRTLSPATEHRCDASCLEYGGADMN